MKKLEIRQPIWKYPRSIGIAGYRIIDDLEIEISYRNKEGEQLFPFRYFITKEKARSYPTQMVKGTLLYIIPICDLQILDLEKPVEPTKEELVANGREMLIKVRKEAGL